MPSALILARASGLYCRVLVPRALRALLGRRYIVRALGTHNRDEARLAAALLAWEARAVFAALQEKEGGIEVDDPKELLKKLDPDKLRKYKIKRGDIEIEAEGAEDHARAMEAIDRMGRLPAHIVNPQVPGPTLVLPSAQTHAPKPERPVAFDILLSKRKETHKIKFTSARKSAKVIDEYDRALRLLIECCGDKPPADYVAGDADKFEEMIDNLPMHNEAFRDPDIPPKLDKKTNRLQYTMLSAPKMVELNRTLDLPKISSRTKGKHMDRVRAFFNWCFDRHYMGRDNFFAKRTQDSNESNTRVVRVPFDEEDVARIFAPERFLVAANEPHKFWGPLLALLTGGRRNEIGQLYLKDIIQDGSHWGIGIDAIYPRQRIKNKFSQRSIPLHSKLIELGFLDYVADVKKHGFDRLFPMLPYTEENGYGDSLADIFHRYLRSKKPLKPGAKDSNRKSAPHVGIDDKSKVFHSFRYRFCNRLYQKHPPEKVKELSGHEREGVFNSIYAGQLDFENKIPIIESLPLPLLDFPRYQPGQWDAYFIKLKRKKAKKAANEAAKEMRKEDDV